MPNNIPGDVIGELFEVGKSVGGQVKKLPQDIAGKAMESMGAKSIKPQAKMVGSFNATPNPHSAWEKFDHANDESKKSMARKALQELLGRPKVQKEPSIWERLQREEEEKKKQKELEQQAQSKQLQPSASKRPVGDLYGTKAKKLGSEIGKNARQD